MRFAHFKAKKAGFRRKARSPASRVSYLGGQTTTPTTFTLLPTSLGILAFKANRLHPVVGSLHFGGASHTRITAPGMIITTCRMNYRCGPTASLGSLHWDSPLQWLISWLTNDAPRARTIEIALCKRRRPARAGLFNAGEGLRRTRRPRRFPREISRDQRAEREGGAVHMNFAFFASFVVT
jgi:hypothetical protein